LNNAFDSLHDKGTKTSTSKMPILSQSQDVDMIVEEGGSNDDDYITEEEVVQGFSRSPQRGPSFFGPYS
jgi:hypothetical protein